MSGKSQKHAISHLIVGRNKTTRCQTPGPQHNMPFTVTKNKQTEYTYCIENTMES